MEYQRSYQEGEWTPLTLGMLRKILKHICGDPNATHLEINQGAEVKAGGWGIVRRKPGRWNQPKKAKKRRK